MLPSTSIVDTSIPPNPGGTIEIDKVSLTISTRLFYRKVSIQSECLQTGECAVIFVDMFPTGLHHPELIVANKMRDGSLEEIFGRKEIRIEDRSELPFRFLESVGQSSRLVSHPLFTLDVFDIESFRLPVSHSGLRFLHRLVVSIVQHLNLKLIGRVIQLGNAIDQSFNHIQLVVNRKLNRHMRPIDAIGFRALLLLLHLISISQRQVQLHETVQENEGQ